MITIVGIGAEGWAGLPPASRSAIKAATTLMGSPRQLALVPTTVAPHATRELLPSPLLAAIDDLATRDSLCLLASGDPMLHGIGATLARHVPPAGLRVLPAVSSISLAAARLGWPLAEATVVSLVTADPSVIVAHLTPCARLLLLARDGSTASAVAALLGELGWGTSVLHICANLGGPGEQVGEWAGGMTPDLVVIGVECLPDPATVPLPRLAGLPDDAFANDGALTRREVRALVLAELRPSPGHLLWDVGAGSGSIGVEWLRAEPAARAVAIEPREERRTRITVNMTRLGAPGLVVIAGSAPDALADLPQPQAVFIGGGLTAPGTVEACWDALASGGRLVATAVTIESEALLHEWAGRVGGSLTRLELSRAQPLGSFTTWRPELPVVVWAVVKP